MFIKNMLSNIKLFPWIPETFYQIFQKVSKFFFKFSVVTEA